MDSQAGMSANCPGAAPEPGQADGLAGKLVTETFDHDGGRQVTVNVPPAPPEAVVFAGDGQLISRWGGYLKAADATPAMIVGACRTDDEDEMARIREYSPSFDANRFAAHERFFVQDVRRGCGYGLGSRFPLIAPRRAASRPAASYHLPWVFDIRTSMVSSSPLRQAPVTVHRPRCRARYRPPTSSPAPRSLSLENATRWADALRDAGTEVVMTERVGNHGDAFWAAESH